MDEQQELPAEEPVPSAPGVLRMAAELAAGTRPAALHSRVRRGTLVRPYRGTYLDPRLAAEDPARQQLKAAAAHLGPEAVAVLGSAVQLHGIHGLLGDRLPELALPPGLERLQRAGVVLRFWTIHPDDVTLVDGIPVTTVPRTLADICRYLPRMQAVACLDSAVHLGLLDAEAIAGLGLYMARRPHCVAGRRRLAEFRIGAQSPLETRVRLRACDAGLPPDELQVPIRDGDGRLLGYGDMGYRLPDGTWLIVEADGRSVHEAPEALLHDRRRQNDFLRAGAPIVRFTWADTTSAGCIPSVLRPLLQAAGWRPPRRPPRLS